MTQPTNAQFPQGSGQKPSTSDQILDLLLDALADRQRARGPAPLSPQPSRQELPPPRPEPSVPAPRRTEPPPAPAPKPAPPEAVAPPAAAALPAWKPSINLGKTLGRLLLLVAVLVVAVNIPVTRHGVSLARIMPETGALIIRDGLVLKGTGSEIYMLEDDKLRWISSMDAFEHLGLSWADVHVVDDEFLEQFEMGSPVHLILKCDGSPHIYALENGVKRWIKDIDTFTAEGYVWDDVNSVTCPYLRSLPDGVPIPEDAGAPPQP